MPIMARIIGYNKDDFIIIIVAFNQRPIKDVSIVCKDHLLFDQGFNSSDLNIAIKSFKSNFPAIELLIAFLIAYDYLPLFRNKTKSSFLFFFQLILFLINCATIQIETAKVYNDVEYNIINGKQILIHQRPLKIQNQLHNRQLFK